MNTTGVSRRNFLKQSGLVATAVLGPSVGLGEPKPAPRSKRPNVVLIVADQFRADFVGALGQNPSTHTPTLDAMAQRGTLFRNAVTNSPVCAPSRACMMTGRYATENGVWRMGLEMSHSLPTLARVLKQNGYSTNFIGKWHLAAFNMSSNPESWGFVPPGPSRGGFDDLWQGANNLDQTSHPFDGVIWNGDGKRMEYHNQYRVDFLTDLAVRFIEQPHDKPFLLFVSQFEPHQTDDTQQCVAPKGYAERYANPFVPPDLLHLPGNWQGLLPGYYGDVQAIDESIGRILKTLDEQHLTENTIIAFASDHGCTFNTHYGYMKRSPQDSSIRIPFQFQGPGFDQALELSQIVSMISLAPTLLDAAGVEVPSSMQGKSLMPLLTSSSARESWDNTAFIQLSQMMGRAIRTREWCYAAVAPYHKKAQEFSPVYEDAYLYNISGDPAELTNLVNRPEYRETVAHLREITKRRMLEAGEPPADIEPSHGTY